MLMEDPHPTRSATRFGLAALAWSLAFFAFLYTPGVQHRLLLPLTRLEKAVAGVWGWPFPSSSRCW